VTLPVADSQAVSDAISPRARTPVQKRFMRRNDNSP
jgi:hypothetical protein